MAANFKIRRADWTARRDWGARAPAEAAVPAYGRANVAANGTDGGAGGRGNDGQISNHPVGNAAPAAALSTLPNSSVIKSEQFAGVRCSAAE